MLMEIFLMQKKELDVNAGLLTSISERDMVRKYGISLSDYKVKKI